MSGLLTFYIAATIFGGGVTLVDLFGIFSHALGHGSGDHAQDTHDAAHDGFHASGHHPAADHPVDDQPSVVGHHERRAQRYLGIRALTAIRTLVYFAFGFGPIGWISLGAGGSALSSLLWSLPTGILFAAGGLLLRRVQGSVLDSQIRDDELYMEEAEVIVPIEAGQMGKVRVILNGIYVERFAKAREPGVSFAKGAIVRIVTVSEEFVAVSKE